MGARFVWLLLAGLVLTACEVVTSNETAVASKRVHDYLTAIQSGDYGRAAAFYPADKAQEWKTFLAALGERLGRLRSFDIEGPETNIVFSGKYYIFILDGEYERGTTEEVITLFQGLKEPLPHLAYHKVTKERARRAPGDGPPAVEE